MSNFYNETREKIICETKRLVKEKRKITKIHRIPRKEQVRQILEAMKISLKILSEMNRTQLEEMKKNYDLLTEEKNNHTFWAYYISITSAINDIVRFHDMGLNSKNYTKKRASYYKALSITSSVNQEKIKCKFPSNRDHVYLELSISLKNCGLNDHYIQDVYDFVKFHYDKTDNGNKFKEKPNRKYNKSSWDDIIKKKTS